MFLAVVVVDVVFDVIVVVVVVGNLFRHDQNRLHIALSLSCSSACVIALFLLFCFPLFFFFCFIFRICCGDVLQMTFKFCSVLTKQSKAPLSPPPPPTTTICYIYFTQLHEIGTSRISK